MGSVYLAVLSLFSSALCYIFSFFFTIIFSFLLQMAVIGSSYWTVCIQNSFFFLKMAQYHLCHFFKGKNAKKWSCIP